MKLLAAVASVFLAASPALAEPASCPASLKDGARSYPFASASVFDGPPEQMADLVPDGGKGANVWDVDGLDPYLVCRYKGTKKTVNLHAAGAKSCEARRTGASCK